LNGVKWSIEEDTVIRKHYPSIDQENVMKLLPNRTWNAIQFRGRTLGISRRRRNAWTESEDEVLYNNYGEISVKEICKLLPNRTYSAIVSRASLIGLISYGNRKNIHGVRHCQLCGKPMSFKKNPGSWICNTFECPRIYEKYKWNPDKGEWVCYEYADSAIPLNSVTT